MSVNPSITQPTQRRRDDVNGLLLVRCFLGGGLMGLANLVPGISGGTMLLATGIYDRFIWSVSAITTLRLRLNAILLLAFILAGAGIAIVLGSETLGTLVHEQRWIMFSLFIGLTLGGVPLLWSMLRPMTGRALIGCVAGLAVMVVLALVDLSPSGSGSDGSSSWILLLIAGAAGGATMVLPGVSGSYVLLVLGQYLTILAAIAGLRDALESGGDWGGPLEVLVPVGIGALIGVVLVSNLMQWLLQHARSATLGVLLGFLIGAVFGLWPFHAPLNEIQMVEAGWTGESIENLKPRDWPVEAFDPSLSQILGAIGLVILGFATSLVISLMSLLTVPRPTARPRN